MLFHLLAHAGEEHSSSLDALNHSTPWYIALPVFFVVVAMIGYLTWIVSGKKLDTVAMVLAIVLLISGFTLFNISAAISVISLTVGIILAGAMAFLGIAGDTKKK
jgi:predicted membrane protein